MKKTKAFTLMEFLIVVIIIGLIIAFTVPKYGKAVAKADERNMITNLKTMRVAVDMYMQDGDALGVWIGLTAINSNLGLSILDTKAMYSCGNAAIVGGDTWTNYCSATHPNGWVIVFHDEHSNRKVHCGSLLGPCPSCPAAPGDCE